jgi:hypothetical protein
LFFWEGEEEQKSVLLRKRNFCGKLEGLWAAPLGDALSFCIAQELGALYGAVAGVAAMWMEQMYSPAK